MSSAYIVDAGMTPPGKHTSLSVRNLGAMALVTGACALLVSGAVGAQDKYPSRPITIIVSFAAGASPDVTQRMLADQLQKRVGQPVLVENKPGAGSTIGTAYVAKAKPDGYTFMHGGPTGLSVAPALFKDLPYDPQKDFAAITITQESAYALMVQLDEKGNSLTQFIEKMRKNPERYPVGGTSISTEIVNYMLGGGRRIPNTYIRYANQANMMSDLLGGRLAIAIQTINGTVPYVTSGRVHAIAVSSPERASALPGVPAMVETLPGATLAAYSGLYLPAKTPKPIIDYLYSHIAVILKQPEMAKRQSDGGVATYMTPEEADAYMKRETPKWLGIIKEAGIQPE